jgi:endonuclease YncB( thermonuclease family)
MAGRAGLRTAALIGGLLLAAGGTGARAERPLPAVLAALPEIAAGTVSSVEDGATLTLDDGRVLRLGGLLAPAAPLALGKDAVWPVADAARQALADLAFGRKVSLRAARATPDRHGRLVGQMILADGSWLQRVLLREGRDRVEVTPDTAELAPVLLTAEADGRRHRRGLWRLPGYAVKTPDALTARDTGGFVLVEARVLSVAPTHEATYLDFAEDWRHGFTVRIPHAVLQRAAAAGGFDPATLEGSRVRVRGWLAYEGRPIIELDDPAALELLPGRRKSVKRP